MLESSSTFFAPNYSHVMHTLEGTTSLILQLSYNIDLVLELKAELTKIKTKVKEIKRQLSVIYLSSINEIRGSFPKFKKQKPISIVGEKSTRNH